MTNRLLERIQDKNSATLSLGSVFKRQREESLCESIRLFEYGKRRSLRSLDKDRKRLQKEEDSRRSDISNLKTYFGSNDYHEITREVSEEEIVRNHHLKLLKKNDLKSGCHCNRRHSCNVFPCAELKSYHFMFKIVNPSVGLHVQRITLVDVNSEKSKLKNRFKSETTGDNKNKANVNQGISNNRAKSDSPTGDVKMSKKEKFLKCAVLKRRLENIKDKQCIDIATHYGKTLPWRMLLRPVRPTTCNDIELIGKKRLMAF